MSGCSVFLVYLPLTLLLASSLVKQWVMKEDEREHVNETMQKSLMQKSLMQRKEELCRKRSGERSVKEKMHLPFHHRDDFIPIVVVVQMMFSTASFIPIVVVVQMMFSTASSFTVQGLTVHSLSDQHTIFLDPQRTQTANWKDSSSYFFFPSWLNAKYDMLSFHAAFFRSLNAHDCQSDTLGFISHTLPTSVSLILFLPQYLSYSSYLSISHILPTSVSLIFFLPQYLTRKVSTVLSLHGELEVRGWKKVDKKTILRRGWNITEETFSSRVRERIRANERERERVGVKKDVRRNSNGQFDCGRYV